MATKTLYGVVNDFLGYTEPKMNVLHFRLHIVDDQLCVFLPTLRSWHELSGTRHVAFDKMPDHNTIYERELRLSVHMPAASGLCLKEGSRFMVFNADIFLSSLATFLSMASE